MRSDPVSESANDENISSVRWLQRDLPADSRPPQVTKERQRLESIEKIFQSCDIEENKHLTQLTDVLRKLFYKHVWKEGAYINMI